MPTSRHTCPSGNRAAQTLGHRHGSALRRDVGAAATLKRDRSLITCAVLTALYRPDQLRYHIGFALDNGVTQDELAEMMTHVAFYAGHPCAVAAGNIAYDVFALRQEQAEKG